MASLNRLRSKGGVIVAIVIGIALLAFVLGDLLTSGSTLMGNSKMNVGTIEGDKISTFEYAQMIDEMTEIQRITTGQTGSTEEAGAAIREQAWNQIVMDKAFKPAAADAGLTVSEAEMVSLLSGDMDHISPIIAQFRPFLDPQTGMFSPEYLRAFIMQVDEDETGQTRLLWSYLQNEVMNWSLQSKFGYLSNRSAYVTSFEAKKIAELTGKQYDIQFIAERYDDMADSLVKVTDADLKKYYDTHKGMFRQEDSREIEYVTFEALPSQADYAAAETHVAKIAEELAEAANVQQFVSFNSHSPFNPRYYKEGQLTGELGAFAFASTAAVGEEDHRVYGPVLNGDQWTLARVADIQVIPDSIRLSSIVMEAAQKQTIDSLVQALKGGADFATAALMHSLDQAGALQGGDLDMMDPQTLQPQFALALRGAKKGDVVKIEDGRGIAFILKVTDIVGEARRVQLGIINYNIEPSEFTRNEAHILANQFATKANASGFDKAVTEDALAKRIAQISPNDRTVGGIQQSRELARWAFNGKKGEVSNVMEFENNFVIARISTIRNKGIAPFDQVQESVRQQVLNEKKGELLSEKMKSIQNLDGQENVITAQEVDFNGFMAPEIGFDPSFTGGIAGMKAGQTVSKPIVGRIGVYTVQVNETENNPNDVEIERARLTAEAEQTAFPAAYSAVIELSDVVDTRYRFY